MRILVACETSGEVREACAALGHDAWSCDVECSERPGNHIRGDVLEVLDDGWDLLIGHPPCTRICNSGVHWLARRNLWPELERAAAFFGALLRASVPRIAIENPIPHRYAVELIGRSYDQIIQPWQFGHPESKATCLWLKGLPELVPSRVLKKPANGRWNNQTPTGQNKLGPSPDRARKRSRTYRGIARQMARQWTP